MTVKSETTRLVPDLTIGDDGLSDVQGKKDLAILKEFIARKQPVRVTISYPGGSRKVKADHLKKAGMLRQYLLKELAVPAAWITLRSNGAAYRVTVDI